MKKLIYAGGAEVSSYASPTCKVHTCTMSRHICQVSGGLNWGDPGEAGGDFENRGSIDL